MTSGFRRAKARVALAAIVGLLLCMGVATSAQAHATITETALARAWTNYVNGKHTQAYIYDKVCDNYRAVVKVMNPTFGSASIVTLGSDTNGCASGHSTYFLTYYVNRGYTRYAACTVNASTGAYHHCLWRDM